MLIEKKLKYMFDFSWMFIAIPFYYKLPVPEVKRMSRLMGIIEKTVYDVIERKRDLLEKSGTNELMIL